MNKTSSHSAFTLVELSIVLVILGLLIGGVLTGQSLIRAAELRSVSTQYSRYVTAVQTFRDKYFGLPGDLTNATSYWGAVDGSTGRTAACATTPSTNALTCNGDGDGKILSDTPSNESFRFWQHLANAGLIEGSYTGITATAYEYNVTALNSPSGRLTSSLWFAYNFTTKSGNAVFFDGSYNNTFQFGGAGGSSSSNIRALLKNEELYNIDVKMDDGKPATGKLVVRNTLSDCTDSAATTALSANYLLTSATPGCIQIFREAY